MSNEEDHDAEIGRGTLKSHLLDKNPLKKEKISKEFKKMQHYNKYFEKSGIKEDFGGAHVHTGILNPIEKPQSNDSDDSSNSDDSGTDFSNIDESIISGYKNDQHEDTHDVIFKKRLS